MRDFQPNPLYGRLGLNYFRRAGRGYFLVFWGKKQFQRNILQIRVLFGGFYHYRRADRIATDWRFCCTESLASGLLARGVRGKHKIWTGELRSICWVMGGAVISKYSSSSREAASNSKCGRLSKRNQLATFCWAPWIPIFSTPCITVVRVGRWK